LVTGFWAISLSAISFLPFFACSATKTNPSPRFYDIVCREYNVNPLWLKTGKGEIYTLPGGSGQSDEAKIMAKFHSLPKPERKLIEDMINALLYKSLQMKNEK
jgi:hypothetical protein